MDNTGKMEIIEKQRRFFKTGKTLPIGNRIMALKKLGRAVRKYEEKLLAALKADLGKGAVEAYMCEIGTSLSEISHMLSHISVYSASSVKHTPITLFPAVSRVYKYPYGNVLIMSPWNYPVNLTIEPLADALAAGNTAIIKPSAYAPETSRVLREMIEETFDPEYVAVIEGGREENAFLLEQHFDHIFFTGSKNTGRIVMEVAAKNLTPVTLELGGKSPCIVDGSARLKQAARRIVFAKFLNCGQTCVAPDYILCDSFVKDELIGYIKQEILRQYGRDPLKVSDYGKIINRKHYERVKRLIDRDKVVHGGDCDDSGLRIAPTVMDNVSWRDRVMGEEIFGPVLPVLTFDDIDDAIKTVEAHDKPLALYIFSTDKENIKKVMDGCRFGGGCVNDCLMHVVSSEMPFGGVGESGIGSYHGKAGFDAFSHKKSILTKPAGIEVPLRYRPYKKLANAFVRMLLH